MTVALNHMEIKIVFLIEAEIFKKGGCILEQTASASSQYKYASALYFMLIIASIF